MNVQQAVDLAIRKAKGNISPQENELLGRWIVNTPAKQYIEFSDACIESMLYLSIPANYIPHASFDADTDLLVFEERFKHILENERADTESIEWSFKSHAFDLDNPEMEKSAIPGVRSIRRRILLVAAALIVLLMGGSFAWVAIMLADDDRIADSSLNGQPTHLFKDQAILITNHGKDTFRLSNLPKASMMADTLFTKIRLPASSLNRTGTSSVLILEGEDTRQTVTVPKGTRYDVHLPDGSRVWLNAQSTLVYPASYGLYDRRLELTGEGLFEITKDANKPFTIAAGSTTIQVLGTRLNVNSYSNEPNVRVTLLEGAIRVLSTKGDQLLKQGEQAVVDRERFTTIQVDTAEVQAWRHGVFSFRITDYYTVMREIERWKDIEVDYNVPVPQNGRQMTFRGSRNLSLESILTLMRFGGVATEMDGKRIRLIKK